ncbi:hypothetical protein CLV24_11455 [Pontibacter ummariensis]|uniref:Uncharacterized protein n=1 Tax=Pontibacter ummariensis TaxID=1610492 RepID=A0A239HLV5_9BACT|nr:hypothetical protein [Pontibacter ummariensis]PRY10327.1 hypothetical protein CLV24_11455 [Pontibacter ummariensis]SNS82317.1 hypothetical protein SAMN06296052_11455 [Pontibacter ummariensis]
MDFIERFLDFISDNRRHITTRVIVAAFSFLLFVLVDNMFAFSYNYTIDRSISNARNISELLKDTTLSSTTRLGLERLREEVVTHKTVADHVVAFWRDVSTFKYGTTKVAMLDNSDSWTVSYDLWHLLSSGGLYLLFIIFGVPVILVAKSSLTLLQRFVSALGFIVLFSTIAYVHYIVLELVPDMLFGSWTWNYVLNALVQLTLVGFLASFNKKAEKNKKHDKVLAGV